MNSSTDNPLAFFKHITIESNLLQCIHSLLKYSDFVSYKIKDYKTVEYIELDYYNRPIKGVFELSKVLNPYLKKELLISKNHLKQFCIENEELKVSNYLRLQINSVQKIINDHYELINKYPYVILALRSIVKYINEILILPNTEYYSINEDEITVDFKGNDLIDKSNIELIHEIFDYMKGKNEKQEFILNEEDFNTLISYTTYLVENGEIPEIQNKITPNLKKGLISYSYWVLHKELYTSNKIKPYFISFIKLLFSDFKDSQEKSIKNQFGSKTRFYNHNFLPEIISKYLEK